MKNCKFFILLSFFTISLFMSCASTDNKNVKDNVEKEKDLEVTKITEVDENQSETGNIKSNIPEINLVKKQDNGNSLFSKFDTSVRFCEYADVSVFTANAFNKIKSVQSSMVYVPKTETFGFCSNYLAAFVYMHFDDKGRKAFTKAYNLYLQDFENKKLNRKNNKSNKIYGSTDVYVNWGTIKQSCTNYGNGTAYFGYKFVDGSPYFIITMNPVFNERFSSDNTAAKESMGLVYYFNKAYAKTIVNYLSDETINEVLRQYYNSEYGSFESEDDVYED